MPSGHKVHSVAPLAVSQGEANRQERTRKIYRQRAHPRARSCRLGSLSTKSQERMSRCRRSTKRTRWRLRVSRKGEGRARALDIDTELTRGGVVAGAADGALDGTR